jgi:hypothetical protein
LVLCYRCLDDVGLGPDPDDSVGEGGEGAAVVDRVDVCRDRTGRVAGAGS